MTKKARRKAAQSEPPSLLLHFLGANKTVTGSLHFLEYTSAGKTLRFFVDMGLNQENESMNFQNRLPKGVKAADLSFGIFTHAHIDHVGFFPKLVKDGFSGPVYATEASCDLLGILLPDSGHIQEQDAKRRAERARKREQGKAGSPAPEKLPSEAPCFQSLYTQAEARASLAQLQASEFHKKFSPAPGITVTFLRASHLLGAAIVLLEIGEGANKRRLVFSGDLGRKGLPVIQDMDFPSKADYVVCEGTYGARLHEKRNRLATLAGIINAAYDRAAKKSTKGCGIILMPAFAVGRVQSVLFDLRQLMAQGRIKQIPVFVDSPMANMATAVYRKHSRLYNGKALKALAQGDIFSPARYAELSSLDESLRLDQRSSEPVIVLSSSGMANGGRVTRHLQNRLPDANSSVVFVGFQSEGTLGRHLLDGTKSAWIGGKSVDVRAAIEQMPDYSGHGDYQDILGWLSHFEPRPKKLFLVHGDSESLESLKSRVEQSLHWDEVEIPDYRSAIRLL